MVEDEEGFRDRISTISEKGKRVWIFPKKPKGKLFNYRKITSYLFLILLFGLPHVKYKGEPFILFNILERKFIIFGGIFWPQDFYLFAIASIVGLVFIILFTIIFGRIFCGWVCPQTIFMEMVFRRIEYLIEGDYNHQKKLNAQPWNKEKITKRLLKQSIFWLISFFIANTFLAYIIGKDELWRIQTDPNVHYGGLIATVIFTTVFYLVFARLREQVCTTICPYGRLQGVLLDQNTMVVAYDNIRGEGRAKFKKNEDRKENGKGDCIDCHLCVSVCPTGIDIRNGTQLECINCTACIDECNTIMDGVGLEKGLIRMVSENGIKKGIGFEWTRRVKSYTALLIFLFGVLVSLLVTRSDFETVIFRLRGTTYQMDETSKISNIFEINLTNKTRNKYNISFKLEDKRGEVILETKKLILQKEAVINNRLIIKYPFNLMKDGKKLITIIVLGNGIEIQRVKVKFIGPMM